MRFRRRGKLLFPVKAERRGRRFDGGSRKSDIPHAGSSPKTGDLPVMDRDDLRKSQKDGPGIHFASPSQDFA